MTTVANLLARKRLLVERRQENPRPRERDEIELLLRQIDTALDLLDQNEAGRNSRSTIGRRELIAASHEGRRRAERSGGGSQNAGP